MKKISLVVATVAAFATAAALPASAAPWSPQGLSGPAPQVEQIQYRPRHYDGPRRYYNAPRRHYDGPRRGYYQQSGRYYYNGHRGYNYYRPGYRSYNGWWFPAAAFATGALIGGAIAAQPSYSGGGNAHVQWCANQYRSYRVSDNTFQPYNGPRQQCVSPY
ncbi:BA14K family protein [Ancylobacter oerskovii]|uniref:Lectin-like protein BA14k n=1 Tax=Ancylobacter oerskovii TaxID=459519 RepID=A0ABW4YRP4_9HYPH|nr:BA14K family protein [Ancylobacter oerskovii]MBS7545640.1 BA14K family protein [Ancylobacter oerskovii]